MQGIHFILIAIFDQLIIDLYARYYNRCKIDISYFTTDDFISIVGTNRRGLPAISMEAIEKAREDKFAESLALLTKARLMAEKNNWRVQQIIAINAIGITYGQMHKYGTALSYHLESYKLASKEEDPKYKALVLLNIGCIYIKQEKYKEAEDYFKQIYSIYKANKNYNNLGTVCNNLGLIYNKTNRLDEAKKYLDEAAVYLKDSPQLNHVNLELLENELFKGIQLKHESGQNHYMKYTKTTGSMCNPCFLFI